MILNKEQAGAIYRAMCELNNVCASPAVVLRYGAVHEHKELRVFEYGEPESIRVCRVEKFDMMECEDYSSQNAFAEAYGVL